MVIFLFLQEGLRPGDTTSTFCGTPNYIAPEILRGFDYGENYDIEAQKSLFFFMIRYMRLIFIGFWNVIMILHTRVVQIKPVSNQKNVWSRKQYSTERNRIYILALLLLNESKPDEFSLKMQDLNLEKNAIEIHPYVLF